MFSSRDGLFNCNSSVLINITMHGSRCLSQAQITDCALTHIR